MTFGPNPWQQQHWDWRAAGNFIGGGAGSGLIVCVALTAAPRGPMLLGAALVALGLASVWLEIGRPLRAWHVVFHPRRSWMSREAIVAPPLLLAALAASLDQPFARDAAALLAVAYVYCQGRILQAARGIPAWREPRIVPLLMTTALAEGAGLLLLWLAIASARPAVPALWAGFALALAARWLLWRAWRSRIRAAPRALAALDRVGRVVTACTALPLAGAALAWGTALPGDIALVVQAASGALAAGAGVWFKLVLVTRAAFNQGFALAQLPVRGVRHR